MRETANVNRTEKSAVLVYAAVTRDGRERVFRSAISFSRMAGMEEPVQLSILRDITQETQIERRERQVAEQVQAIMRDVGCGITAVVLDGDGRIDLLFVNDQFFEIHGYTRSQYEAEVTDKYALIHPDDREWARKATIEAYTSRTPARLEYRLVGRDGSVRWVRVSLSSTRFTGVEQNVHLCIFTDITLEKRAEQAIRETSEQLRAMMRDMPGGFVRMRVGGDGKITPVYINEGFMKLVGMSYDGVMELYASDALAGVHPDDVATVNDAVARMFQNGEARSTRYRLRHGSGGYIWLSIFGRVTKDAAGDTFLNVYYTDATEQADEARR